MARHNNHVMVLWNLKKNLPKYFELFILFLNMSNVCCRVKYVVLEILCFPVREL